MYYDTNLLLVVLQKRAAVKTEDFRPITLAYIKLKSSLVYVKSL